MAFRRSSLLIAMAFVAAMGSADAWAQAAAGVSGGEGGGAAAASSGGQAAPAQNGSSAAPEAQVDKKKTKAEEQADVPKLPSSSSVLGGGFFGAATPAQAAVTPGYEAVGGSLSGKHGAPVRMGGVLVYPKLLVSTGRNSNVAGANENYQTDLYSATVRTVQPEVDAQLTWRGDRYGLVYRGNFTRYSNYSKNPDGSDDADNHTFELYGENVYSSRARLSWGAGYQLGADGRGSKVGVTNLQTSPDRWRAPTARTMFAYGAPGSQGRLEFELNYIDKRYQNNLDSTAKLSYSSTNVATRFFYRLQPKTRALVEVRRTYIKYPTPGSGADDPMNGNETRLYAGLNWEATAATSGTIKFGRMNKTFDGNRNGANDTSWEAGVKWQPLNRTTLDFTASRALSDGTGTGAYTANSNYTLAWTHLWTERINTRLSYSTLKSSFVGAGRDDNTRNTGLKISYEWYRWLSLGLEYTDTTRSSNVDGQGFRRNVTMFSAEGTL